MTQGPSRYNVLMVFANPQGANSLRLGIEDRMILESIKLSPHRDKISVRRCHAATVHHVRRALLEDEFHIVHISSHGTEKGLVLENELGEEYLVPQEALAELFQAYSPPLECVILNACYSVTQGNLISLGVPFTIVIEGSISDAAATEFSRGFYDALGAGKDIEFAYHEGCRTIKLSRHDLQPVPRLLTRQKPTTSEPDWQRQETSTKTRQRVTLSKLPTTGKELFGRGKELRKLDKAWHDPSRYIISFVAWGGVGKTSIVNHWLSQMAAQDYNGAERVYSWSFYSQGTTDVSRASADEFISAALKWFGDPDPARGTPWEKGVRLADLIREKPTLLVLDGVEPLQYGTGPLQGCLKDNGLKTLLKELAASNRGLCVITTRLPMRDLEYAEGRTYLSVSLDNLSMRAGSELLRTLGVTGPCEELKEVVKEYRGHALALTLLGRYLSVVYNGIVGKHDQIPALYYEEQQGGHARRIMESYENWLQGSSELAILYLMGLFDRPAEINVLRTLCLPPSIEGLTSSLESLTKQEWLYAIANLRKMKLIAEKDMSDPDLVDCHPLVREHFGHKLRSEYPHSWIEANKRLFSYYKGVTHDYRPDSLKGLEPLILSIFHGCRASMYSKALKEVYYPRILRGKNEFFITGKLGAFGSQLSILSNFFEVPWERLVPGLALEDAAFIKHQVGYCLRVMGQPTRSIAFIREARGMYERIGDWDNATMASSHLCRIFQDTGHLSEAIDSARKGITFADQASDKFQQIDARSALAYALISAGRLEEAESFLVEAEEIQKIRNADWPILHSLPGWRYCDLLILQGQSEQAILRASKGLDKASTENDLLTIGTDYLAIGLAEIYLHADEDNGYDDILDNLDLAVDGFRKAGRQDFLPRALVPRAKIEASMGQHRTALRDLVQAHQVVVHSNIDLYKCDIHLGCAQFCLSLLRTRGEFSMVRTVDKPLFDLDLSTASEGELLSETRRHLQLAQDLIERMGYNRHQPEVHLLYARLGIVEDNWQQVYVNLERAKESAKQMSAQMWDHEFSKLEAAVLNHQRD